MGDERGGIYLALCYQIQNLLTVAAIHSARLEDEVLALLFLLPSFALILM